MKIRLFAVVLVGAVLFCAATSPVLADLQRLVQQKVDVNAAQIDGATALHWAVYREIDHVKRPERD